MSLASLERGRQEYQRFCATCHGENGMGVLGGSRSDDDVGGAGLQSGDETLVPLAGGSGGAGGESGSGAVHQEL